MKRKSKEILKIGIIILVLIVGLQIIINMLNNINVNTMIGTIGLLLIILVIINELKEDEEEKKDERKKRTTKISKRQNN